MKELENSAREHLTTRLPQHLIPSAIIALTHLPLTANGKIDYPALPAPRSAHNTQGRSPRTPREEVLCSLYAEILGTDRVSIDDGFFDLGGHSLLATRLLSRIRDTLGADIPLRSLFARPTVAELAEELEEGSDPGDAFAELLPLRTAGSMPPLFCVHPGGGNCWSYANLLPHLSPDFPVYGLQSHALLHPDEMRETIEEVAADCIARMRQVQPTGPYHLLGHSFGGLVSHAMATQLAREGERVALIVSLDASPARQLEEDELALLHDTGLMWGAMLELLGAAPDEIPQGAMTYEEFHEVARTTNTALGSLSEEEVDTMMRVIWQNSRISALYRHERVATDMLLFAAADKDQPLVTAEQWRELIDGEITYHLLDYKHHTIMTPAALERLGPLIEERLRQA